MKKLVQNVLAADSNGGIAYICGRCGKEIEKEAKICSFCGARLGNIRCPFCNFSGGIDDFKNDTCPKCGRKNKNQPNKKINNINNVKNINKVTSIFITNRIFFILLIILISGISLILLIYLLYFGFI